MSKKGIQPGATIGLLGGGQLGRMFAIEARKMGYRVYTFEPQLASPAGQISDREFTAAYDNMAALDEFAASVDVVTFEFENIPTATIERIASQKPVHPRAEVLHICQNREREKLFLRKNGFPVAPFWVVTSALDLEKSLVDCHGDAVLKTAAFGYDGKGQLKIDRSMDAATQWGKFDAPRAVLEKWITHVCELSVIVARGSDGKTSVFPVAENIHQHHILDISIVPARIDQKIQERAADLAVSIAEQLGVIGLLAVEFFLTETGELLVNELAPRPHNSGHYSFDACVTSQFEQQLRAVCDLPFGSTRLLSPVVMANLLGDLWKNTQPPDFSRLLEEPDIRLNLYGKFEGRKGRKMGHFCVLKASVDEALAAAKEIQNELVEN